MTLIQEFAFQDLLKNISKNSIDKTQLDRARWRWEFLRLNDDYIRDCSNLKKDISEQLPTQNKYGLTCWINPELTFDEYLKVISNEISKSNYESIDKHEALRYLAISNMGGPFQNCIFLLRDDGIQIDVKINLGFPDNEILEQVSELLRERRGKITKQRPKKTLENWLKAISLKKAGKTLNEIAAIMFPPPDADSDESVPDLNEDSVMRMVSRYISDGKDLVNGGYKYL